MSRWERHEPESLTQLCDEVNLGRHSPISYSTVKISSCLWIAPLTWESEQTLPPCLDSLAEQAHGSEDTRLNVLADEHSSWAVIMSHDLSSQIRTITTPIRMYVETWTRLTSLLGLCPESLNRDLLLFNCPWPLPELFCSIPALGAFFTGEPCSHTPVPKTYL